MSGLVTPTTRNGNGSGYADANPSFRRITSSQTISRPFGCSVIIMECIGGGGGGGGGAGAGGGGGGGALSRMSISAESLGGT